MQRVMRRFPGVAPRPGIVVSWRNKIAEGVCGVNEETISKKSQRLRLYFAQTARDIILESGAQAVSVRSIAKRAGYAYATLYNHFENLDELLWLTRSLFIEDIAADMDKNAPGRAAQSTQEVCALFVAYADYFVRHPAAYEFLYFYPLQKDVKKTRGYHETEAFQEKFRQTFAYLSAQKTPQEVENAIKTILYAIHGLLTLCIAGNDDLSIRDIPDEIGRIVRFALD